MSVKLNRRLRAIAMAQPSQRQPSQCQPSQRPQQGVVLFFALIALVVMSLAAVALIRSVDSNSMIAANLSFKQSTMLSADRGVEAALTWVNTHSALLAADSLDDGYYATSLLDAQAQVDSGRKVSLAADDQGNIVSYVVQRMCQVVGAPNAGTPTYCLSGPSVDSGCSNNVSEKNQSKLCPEIPTVFYRVTAKVVDGKNTVSYVQAFVY